jgi:CubicO group peptidase (beta-lactamase class C family)
MMFKNYSRIIPGCCVLLIFLHGSIASCQPKNKIKNDKDFTLLNPSKEGFDASVLNKIDTAVSHGSFPNIHSVLIAKDNKLVFEKYWPGKDEVWAVAKGIIPHSRDSLHDIRSISKSIVAACFGILLQQGKIKSVHQKIFDFFPEYAKQDTGLKSLLTIEHLLTMTSGLKWNEDIPYNNPENSEIRMIKSGHPVDYVLNQPMEIAPGKVWKYNGGTTQLLAAIIERTSGQKITEFARKYIFTPLGITHFEWAIYPGTTEYAAASGLRLRSRDLLKFGLLYLNNGVWNNKQLIPSQWVAASTESHIMRNQASAYGYQFWLFNETIGKQTANLIACVGNGDQRIFIDKARKLVIVITAGNYNLWEIRNDAAELSRRYIYAALKEDN